MITPSSRSVVSFLSLAAMLTIGGCARLSSHAAWDTADAAIPAVVRFDNDAESPVDVYLVSERNQWRLGRVAPGARAMLRVPEAALTGNPGFLKLATLADAPLSIDAASDPRATLSVAQPLPELLSQEWRFSLRQPASPQLLGLRGNGMRP